MKIVKVEDLEIGDEIVIPVFSGFRYLRVLKQPRIGKRNDWITNALLYTSIKCSTKIDVVEHSKTWGNGQVHRWKKKTYIFTPEDHNTVMSVDLNYKDILLVRKSDI
jgi:hypothetical protein